MLNQRKYIISAFLIFSFVFIGFYFAISTVPRCGTTDALAYINKDTSKRYVEGKALFNQCGACHILFKNSTGPDLIGFTRRGPWSDKKKILSYLNDPFKFYNANRSKYIDSVWNAYPAIHQGFICNEKQVDDLIYYLESEERFRKGKKQ